MRHCTQPVRIVPTQKRVLNAKTVRGSIVGTRKALQEALEFAGEGKVRVACREDGLDNINQVFDRMRRGDTEGRIVMRMEMSGTAPDSSGRLPGSLLELLECGQRLGAVHQ